MRGIRVWFRVLFVGGLISYRALFNWIRPGLFIPFMLLGPLFQVVFFTYVGRYTGVANDSFFVIGSAVQVCSLAGLYGMVATIGGERWTGTLSSLLATPASRLPLFLGRTLPVIANGLLVSAFGLAVGTLMFHVRLPSSSVLPLVLVMLVATISCTAFGTVVASLGLRTRDIGVLANQLFYILLLFSGAVVPLDRLSPWMADVARFLPMTHAIEAAREVAAGQRLTAVDGLLVRELAVAAGYGALAYLLLRVFELEGRRKGTLEVA